VEKLEIITKLIEEKEIFLFRLELDEQFFQRKKISGMNIDKELGSVQSQIRAIKDYISFLKEKQKDKDDSLMKITYLAKK